tara:strand:- start:390 stop:623 length:234 start_codon:yes stop_codon:yes gene_type:complete
MSDIVNIKCPSCKKRTKAERKSKYFHKIGCGMAIVHIIMLLITGGFWIGWLIGSWYFAGKINFCLKCNQEVDNERII